MRSSSASVICPPASSVAIRRSFIVSMRTSHSRSSSVRLGRMLSCFASMVNGGPGAGRPVATAPSSADELSKPFSRATSSGADTSGEANALPAAASFPAASTRPRVRARIDGGHPVRPGDGRVGAGREEQVHDLRRPRLIVRQPHEWRAAAAAAPGEVGLVGQQRAQPLDFPGGRQGPENRGCAD